MRIVAVNSLRQGVAEAVRVRARKCERLSGFQHQCPSCSGLLVVQEGADRREVLCDSCHRSWGGQDYLALCLGGVSMRAAKEAER